MVNFNPQRYLRSLGFEYIDYGCDRIYRHPIKGRRSIDSEGYSIQFTYDDNIIRKEWTFIMFQYPNFANQNNGGYRKVGKFDEFNIDEWETVFNKLGWNELLN